MYVGDTEIVGRKDNYRGVLPETPLSGRIAVIAVMVRRRQISLVVTVGHGSLPSRQLRSFVSINRQLILLSLPTSLCDDCL